MPQLIENYKLKSAEGISLAFLTVWFIGDVANLIGAVWAGLVPTVVALAIYFCFADSVLIVQCLYYNFLNAKKQEKNSPHGQSVERDDPEQPLLRRRSSNIGLPGSRRRSSVSMKRRDSSLTSPLLPAISEAPNHGRQWLKNTISIVLICLVGLAGWAVCWKSGLWTATPDVDNQERILGAEILGYASAVAYLG